ncbi:MAG: IucA/IucC family protein [bacterium]|nr:IucA/IucC family protein [bacterium]
MPGKQSKVKYKIELEYKNISDYSPFWRVNGLSPEYRRKSFELPFICFEGKLVPVHPDMFCDLGLGKNLIVKRTKVYPTSSFRTVFNAEENLCWKLPVRRKITRGVRDLKTKQLQRAERVQTLLKKFDCPHFSFLEEECFFASDENFNYIERKMPAVSAYPLFYVIKDENFSKKFILKVIENIMYTWMFWAEKGLYLEYHTQNILVDKHANIIYRDLSDVRSYKEEILKPSYINGLKDEKELRSLMFDRSVCSQNLDHFLRYKSFTQEEISLLKSMIQKYSNQFKIEFPEYSLDFNTEEDGRVPYKKEINHWRGDKNIRAISTSEKRLAELRKVFDGVSGNFTVRGSYARGDDFYNDIDIALYSNSLDVSKLPSDFRGVKVNYWQIPAKDIERYYEVCVRPSISLIEGKVIKTTDPEVEEILERQQNKFYEERADIFLLYLVLDEESNNKIYGRIHEKDYSTWKRKRGSKRTILRAVWAVKTMYPEIKDRNVNEVLSFMVQKNIISKTLSGKCQEVLEMIFEEEFDEKRLESLIDQIGSWYEATLKPLLIKKIYESLDRELVENSLLSIDNQTSKKDLGRIYEFAIGREKSIDKWLLFFGLSRNTNLGEKLLFEIYNMTKDDFVFNNVTRNLILNVAFPKEIIVNDQIILRNDLTKIAYKKRKLLEASS